MIESENIRALEEISKDDERYVMKMEEDDKGDVYISADGKKELTKEEIKKIKEKEK